MLQQDPDKVIALVQSSTRTLMNSFRGKTDLLRQCHKDIKLLIREGYDKKTAYETALAFFGKNRAKFIAIDGTESQDQELDILVFYAGAFGYIGQLEFSDTNKGCTFNEPVELEGSASISAAISIHEQDTASIAGQATEGGIEVDAERIPAGLMRLAEYYMAVKAVYDEDSDIRVIIHDGSLAGDIAHLAWSVNEMLDANSCVLQGMDTEYGPVTALDLELARMLHPNKTFEIPAPRSHLIKYAAINELLGRSKAISYGDLLAAIGADKKRLVKLKKDLSKFDERYSLLDNNNAFGCSLKQEVKKYWERVFSASVQICDYIFNTPEGRHPLIINNGEKTTKWITADDLDYLTLVMVYALLRAAWEKNVLVIGISKDVSAREMVKTVVPILQSTGKIRLARELPGFNSDKMLLQTASVINGADIHAPWRTFEFDTCFRTIAPASSDATSPPTEQGQAAVAGPFQNVISAERMLVKSYIQLWGSDTNPAARSHVFSYDRPCYPKYDIPGDLKLLHRDGPVIEEIRPIIHFQKNDNGMSDLVMDILCSMSSEVIPECLGHNYSLFLADKKAKSILEGSKNAYLSTVSFEIANSDFDQQVLFEARFREYRSDIESQRRSKA
jgi:hypothetical protein